MIRICINPGCGWFGKESDCLDYKHPIGARICPECYEATEESPINEQELDTAITAAQELATHIGQTTREAMKYIYQSAAAFGVALAGILPLTNDPHGWNETWERQVKKLKHRERYLRRYRQRGLRMKKGKT